MSPRDIPPSAKRIVIGGLALLIGIAWLVVPPAIHPDPYMATWKPAGPRLPVTWSRIGPSELADGASARWLAADNELFMRVIDTPDPTKPYEASCRIYRTPDGSRLESSDAIPGMSHPRIAVSSRLIGLLDGGLANDPYRLVVLDRITLRPVYDVESPRVAGSGAPGSDYQPSDLLALPDGSLAVLAGYDAGTGRIAWAIARFNPSTRTLGHAHDCATNRYDSFSAVNDHQIVLDEVDLTGSSQWMLVDVDTGSASPAPLSITPLLSRRNAFQAGLPTYTRQVPVPSGMEDVQLERRRHIRNPDLALTTEAAEPPLVTPSDWQAAPRTLSAYLRLLQATLRELLVPDAMRLRTQLIQVNAVHLLYTDSSKTVRDTVLGEDVFHPVRLTVLNRGSSGLSLFPYDGVRALVLEVVSPVPSGIAPHGLMRFGLIGPPYQSIQWQGWIPLPDDLPPSTRTIMVQSRPGTDRLLIGLSVIAQSSSDQQRPTTSQWVGAIPYSSGIHPTVMQGWGAGWR